MMTSLPVPPAPSTLPPPPPRRPEPDGPAPPPRRPWRVLIATVVLSAVVGGLAGATAGRLSAGQVEAGIAPVPTTTTVVAPATTVAAPAGTADVPAIATALRPSVVSINVTATVAGPQGRPITQQGSGTGFAITTDGQIVTNQHVIAGATTITVVLGDTTTLPATVIGSSADEDLAVLHVDRTDLAPVTIGSSAALRVGETAVAIGNALALPGGPTVSLGIVSALGRSLTVGTTTYAELIQTDAAISPGNSGGPLVDHEGTVIGINCAAASSSTNAENVSFAIAIDHAVPVLRALGARL